MFTQLNYHQQIQSMKIIIWKIFLLATLVACSTEKNKDAFTDCKYGRPEAIFNPEHPAIQKHNFSIKERESQEEILFKNGQALTIIQNGCNSIQQDFQFKLSGAFQDKNQEFWLNESIKQFKFLSSLGPDYAAYELWAQAILQKAEQMKLAQQTPLEAGFQFKFDRIISDDHAILMLTLSKSD